MESRLAELARELTERGSRQDKQEAGYRREGGHQVSEGIQHRFGAVSVLSTSPNNPARVTPFRSAPCIPPAFAAGFIDGPF